MKKGCVTIILMFAVASLFAQTSTTQKKPAAAKTNSSAAASSGLKASIERGQKV